MENSTRVRNTIHNSAWLIGEKIFALIFGFFVTAFVARYFGPDLFGQFNYALSFVVLFTAISTLGLETLSVKAIVNKDYSEGEILFTSLLLRVIGGFFLTVLATTIIKFIEPNDKNIQILVFILSVSMVIKSLEVIEFWIQAYQKAKISSTIRILAYIVISTFKLFVVLKHGSVIHLALVYLADAVIVGIALIYAYYKYRNVTSTWKINIEYGKNILAQSWYLIIAGLMVTIYTQIDKVMLGILMPSRASVGVYSVATRIATIWYFVPMALITSMKPVIFEERKINRSKYLNSMQHLYTIIAWIGILFGIFILLISNYVIIHLFGQEYQEASSILTISVWAGIFATLGSARSIWLISEGLQKYTLFYTMVGVVTNIVLNTVLIPRIGALGAAISTLISQISANVLALFVFRKTRISSVMILKAFWPVPLISYLINKKGNRC